MAYAEYPRKDPTVLQVTYAKPNAYQIHFFITYLQQPGTKPSYPVVCN
jgi:hypothetical protein